MIIGWSKFPVLVLISGVGAGCSVAHRQTDITVKESLPLTGLAVQIHNIIIRNIMDLDRVAVPDGELMDLDMVPIQLRNFRINRPGDADIQWLHHVVAHQYGRFGGKVEVTSNSTMRLISQ